MKSKLITGLVLIFALAGSTLIAGSEPIPEGELENDQEDSLLTDPKEELVTQEEEVPELLLRSGGYNPFGTVQTEPTMDADEQESTSSTTSDLAIGTPASLDLVHKMEISISGDVGLDDVASASFVPFPTWALAKGQCRVFVRYLVEINSSGSITSNVLTIVSSGNPEWDYVTRDAVRGWRFASAGGGEARQAWISVTYNLMTIQ